jgi:hypothetical protein
MSNDKRTSMLINVAILGDRNVVNKEAEHILKYKGLKTEIQHMWNVKTKVIPVTKEATGTMPKSFIKYLINIPEKYKTTKKPSYWALHTFFRKY